MGPTAGLNAVEKRISLVPAGSRTTIPQLLTSSAVTTAIELPCLLLQQYKKGDVTIIENPVIIQRTRNRLSILPN